MEDDNFKWKHIRPLAPDVIDSSWWRSGTKRSVQLWATTSPRSLQSVNIHKVSSPGELPAVLTVTKNNNHAVDSSDTHQSRVHIGEHQA